MALRTFQFVLLAIGLFFLAGGGGGMAAGPEAGNHPGEMPVAAKTVNKVISQHARGLLAIPGVVGVAQGQCGNRPCLKVFVIQKTPELEQKIPSTLEGYPVVIEETGEIRALPEKSREPKNK